MKPYSFTPAISEEEVEKEFPVFSYTFLSEIYSFSCVSLLHQKYFASEIAQRTFCEHIYSKRPFCACIAGLVCSSERRLRPHYCSKF